MIIYKCNRCGARWQKGIIKKDHDRVCKPKTINRQGKQCSEYKKETKINKDSSSPSYIVDNWESS